MSNIATSPLSLEFHKKQYRELDLVFRHLAIKELQRLIAGLEERTAIDALWDSMPQVYYSREIPMIRFEAKGLARTMELVVKYMPQN